MASGLLLCGREESLETKLILVAVNALNGRDAAFERALALARPSGATLYLLHAVPANQLFSHGAAERLERLSDMRRRAEEAGVRVQSVEQHGDPADIIELHANARGVDLIVMGGEPRRGWGRHRSAVAETVIRRTKVPTLVVPSGAPGQPVSFRNVLVALDLSPASEEILRCAIGFTSDQAAQLTLIHAAKGVEAADAVRSPARWMVPEYRTHVLEDARRRLEAIASNTPASVDTRVHLSTGPAVRTILDQAADLNADLVVVGRSRGFKMLGSTARRVLRKNDRALLVIPSVAPRVERTLAA
jgi:nucleotide-binding universal stress UspA family protein